MEVFIMDKSTIKISGMKKCQVNEFQTMIKQLKEKGNKIIFVNPEKSIKTQK